MVVVTVDVMHSNASPVTALEEDCEVVAIEVELLVVDDDDEEEEDDELFDVEELLVWVFGDFTTIVPCMLLWKTQW